MAMNRMIERSITCDRAAWPARARRAFFEIHDGRQALRRNRENQHWPDTVQRPGSDLPVMQSAPEEVRDTCRCCMVSLLPDPCLAVAVCACRERIGLSG